MDRLVRQLGWLWLLWSISTGALLLLGVLVITGTIPAPYLKVRRLVVTDHQGTPRIVMAMEPMQIVALERKGKDFPVHYIESAAVALYDPQGRQRILLRTNADSSVEVLLYDRGQRVRIGLTTVDFPGITLYDAQGRGLLTLSLGGDAQPRLRIYSPDWQVVYEAP